jgi:hypothetical protein
LIIKPVGSSVMSGSHGPISASRCKPLDVKNVKRILV